MCRCPGFDGGARSRRGTSTIRQPRRNTFRAWTERKPSQCLHRELLDDPTATNALVAATKPHAHIRTKVAEPMKRLSIDMPVNLHRRFKRACTMVAEVLAFIERRTAELERS
jgi:hypothetical protein